jgi:hypothetical protein
LCGLVIEVLTPPSRPKFSPGAPKTTPWQLSNRFVTCCHHSRQLSCFYFDLVFDFSVQEADLVQGAEDELAPLQQLEADALHIDTFSQILEMDEGSDKEFSASIVFDFFDQAEETFKQMDTAL